MDIPNLHLAIILAAPSAADILDWVLYLPKLVFHGYSSAIRWGVDSAQSLFESYGYWVIFFGTF